MSSSEAMASTDASQLGGKPVPGIMSSQFDLPLLERTDHTGSCKGRGLMMAYHGQQLLASGVRTPTCPCCEIPPSCSACAEVLPQIVQAVRQEITRRGTAGSAQKDVPMCCFPKPKRPLARDGCVYRCGRPIYVNGHYVENCMARCRMPHMHTGHHGCMATHHFSRPECDSNIAPKSAGLADLLG